VDTNTSFALHGITTTGANSEVQLATDPANTFTNATFFRLTQGFGSAGNSGNLATYAATQFPGGYTLGTSGVGVNASPSTIYGFTGYAGNVTVTNISGGNIAVGAICVAVGTFTGNGSNLTLATNSGNDLFTGNGTVAQSPKVVYSLAKDSLAPAGSSHSAVLTITGNGTPAFALYNGTQNTYTLPSSQGGNVTVISTWPGGFYTPGLLNKINTSAGNTTGSAMVNGFQSGDTQIIAVALKVTDGNATPHEPSAQEIADLVVDLNKVANQNLPSGWSVTAEPYTGAGAGNLTVDNPAAATFLTRTENDNAGGALDIAFIITGTTAAVSAETFGLNFAGEAAGPDGITSVVTTDIAAVPEPASLSMLILGGLPLIAGNRRRRRLQAA